MEKNQFIFRRENFIIMLIGLGVIALGFLLMSGGRSDNPEVFNPDIFSFRRISVAPALVLLGFGVEVFAILYHPKKNG